MREYLAAYRAAVYRGPRTDAGDPPVLVAALRERMTDLAGTDADGAFPYLVTPERVAWMRARLDAAAIADRPEGRQPLRAGTQEDRHPMLAVTLPVALEGGTDAARAYLRPYLRTPTYHASWARQGFEADDWEAPGSDRLVEAMVAVGTPDVARVRIDELRAAGADHVALIPLAPDGRTEHLPTLEALAP
jgi:alkanesulfonate monooxygenase SsuD/methylene tetrahydromethanopterin reductase-like flavin-dependent oxidoreductase (luciferase family)